MNEIKVEEPTVTELQAKIIELQSSVDDLYERLEKLESSAVNRNKPSEKQIKFYIDLFHKPPASNMSSSDVWKAINEFQRNPNNKRNKG